MKKKFWISAVGVSIVVISIVIYLFIVNNRSTDLLLDLDFTEQITIIGRDTTTTITDKNQIQDVVILVQQGIKPWPRGLIDQIGCPFYITLVFEGSDRKVYVEPATDDCDAIAIDGKMNIIDLGNKTMLFDIIGKYIDMSML